MAYGRISPKYQVVIPKEVRKNLELRPGQRLMIFAKGNVIYLIPELSIDELKGRYQGLNTSAIRDEEDRL